MALYTHNRDRLLFAVVFYLMLALTANGLLWAANAAR
jgi:hypothetical protein